MNIAIFSDTYLPSKNGVATSLAQLKRELSELGHNVYIYTTQVNEPREDDAKIFRSPSLNLHLKVDGRLAFANIIQIGQLIRQQNIELIHTHSEFTMGLAGRYLARKLNIPHVHTLHTLWNDYRHYFFKSRVANKLVSAHNVGNLLASYMSGCTALVAPSPKAKAYLKEIGLNRSYIVNNGVDAEAFSRWISDDEKITLRQQLNLKSDDILTLFVGRIASEKRVLPLYKAFKKLMQKYTFKAMLIGEGPDLKELKQLAYNDKLSHNFIFTGYLPYTEIFKYYAISNIYTTVSLSEVQPMTVIEALISGLPIVAHTDLAYEGLVLDGVNGFIAQNDEDFGRKLSALLDNPALIADFAAASRRHSLNFSAERQAGEMAELYKKAIDWGRPQCRYNNLAG